MPSNNSFHSYYSYTIITERRYELKEYLQTKGIETKINTTYRCRIMRRIKEDAAEIPVAESLVEQILLFAKPCEELIKTIWIILSIQ